jgi:hypothetical protein
MKTFLRTCGSVDLWVTLLEQLSVQLVMLLQRESAMRTLCDTGDESENSRQVLPKHHQN